MLKSRLFTTIGFLLWSAGLLSQDCSISASASIADNDTTLLTLIVENAQNNDLSDPSQGVCKISAHFQHDFLADMTIELISPAGEVVQLIGPAVQNGQFTAFTEWDICFLPSFAPAIPDPGFSSVWNNTQNWVLFPTYTGSYYPHLGSLEDFDEGTVNGVWTIRIVDASMFGDGELIDFTIHFCDPTGLDCSDCEVDSGDLTDSSFEFCEGSENLNLDWFPNYAGTAPDPQVYDFIYILSQNDQLISYTATPDYAAFDPGQYEICALSILASQTNLLPPINGASTLQNVQDSIANQLLCADLNDVCANLNILDALDTLWIEELICRQDTFAFMNESYFEDGVYEIYTQNDECDTIYILDLEVIDIESFIVDNNEVLSCMLNIIELDGSLSFVEGNTTFEWFTPNGSILGANDIPIISVGQAGEYFLALHHDMCSDTSSIIVQADIDFPTVELLAEDLNCNQDSVFINLTTNTGNPQFTWTGPNGFSSELEDPKVGETGIYTATVTNDLGCESFASIEVLMDTLILDPQFDINPLDCSNTEQDVLFVLDSPGYTYNWDGPGNFESELIGPSLNQEGLYTVTVTAANACDTIIQLNLASNYDLLPFSLFSDTINCQNLTAELIVLSDDSDAIISWLSPNGNLSTGDTITTTEHGVFAITIEQSNGCLIDTSTLVVLDDTLPSVQSPNLEILCDTDSLQITANYSDDHYTVQWSGPTGYNSTELFPWVQQPGWYYVEMIDSENFCSSIDSILVNAGMDVPLLDLSADTLNCFNDSVQFMVNLTSGHSYSWEGPNSFISNEIQPFTQEPGTYCVTVTDNANSCTAKYQTTVIQDTIGPQLSLQAQVIDCDNPSTFLEFSSQGLIIDFEWFNAVGFSSNAMMPEVNISGIYYLEAQASNGCMTLDSIEVLSNVILPIVELRDTFLGCDPITVPLNASITGPYQQINWTGPTGFNSDELQPEVNEPGFYFTEISTEEGCIIYDTLEVTTDLIEPSFEWVISNHLSCAEDQANISITSMNTITDYTWTGPDNFNSSNDQIWVSEDGWYFLTISHYNGCTFTDSIEVLSFDEFPNIGISYNQINCSYDSSQITIVHDVMTTPDINWTGPNGFNFQDESFSTDVPGWYFVSVTNENSCTSYDSILIEVDTLSPTILFNPYDTITCQNIMVNLSVETSHTDSLYNWEGPSNSIYSGSNIQVTEAGEYNITVTSTNHCTAENALIVEIDTVHPSIMLTGGVLNCLEGKVNLLAETDAVDFDIEWSGPSGFLSEELDPLTFNSGWHYAKITASNGCMASDSVFVEEDLEIPELEIMDTFLPCNGDMAQLFVEIDTMGVFFQWFGPNGFYTEEMEPFVTVIGEYVLVSSFDNGCLRYDTIDVSDVPILPPFDAFGGTINCQDSQVQLTTDLSDYLSLLWTGPNGFSSVIDSPWVDQPGIYNLAVTTIGDCVSFRQTEVFIDTIRPVALIASPENLLCERQQIELDGLASSQGAQMSYVWKSQGGTILSGENDLLAMIEGAGTYSLLVINEENHCRDSTEVEVIEIESDLEEMIASVNEPVCFGAGDGSIEVIDVFGGEVPYQYSINQGPFQDASLFEGLSSGPYLIQVRDDAGCILERIYHMAEGDILTLDVGPDTTIVLGESVDVYPKVNIAEHLIESSLWVTTEGIPDCSDCFDNNFSPLNTTQYTLSVSNEQGCFATDSITIRVTDEIPVFVPNIFSPDGDGVNDMFFVSTHPAVGDILSILIYDRWGNLVWSRGRHEPNVESMGWNGQFKGSYVMNGVYAYLIEYELLDGTIKQKVGDVTILR